MKNRKILFLVSGFFVAIFATMFFVPLLVQADNYGLDKTAQSAGLPMTSDLSVVIGNVLGSALAFISVLFFGLMLYGGITWMLARGKSENTQKSLDTIIGAVIGLVIILAAYAITNFVFTNVLSGAGGPTTPLPDGGGGGGGAPKTCTVDTDCDHGYRCDKVAESCVVDIKSCEDGGIVCADADKFCNQISHMCVSLADTDCTQEGIVCPSGQECDLMNTKRCVDVVLAGVDGNCGNSLACQAGLICSANNQCKNPSSLGSVCDDDKPCSSGLSCVNSLCTNGGRGLDQTCAGNEVLSNCDAGLTCLLVNNTSTCRTPYTGLLNSPCVPSSGPHPETSVYCSLNLKCIGNKCIARVLEDDYCANNEYCDGLAGGAARCSLSAHECVNGSDSQDCNQDTDCVSSVCNTETDKCGISSVGTDCSRDLECSVGGNTNVCSKIDDECIVKQANGRPCGGADRGKECLSSSCVSNGDGDFVCFGAQ